MIEVITLAHKFAMPAESLGFFMPEFSVGGDENEPSEQKQPDDVPEGRDSDYEPSIAAALPEEAPVDAECGKPLPEDRVVHLEQRQSTAL